MAFEFVCLASALSSFMSLLSLPPAPDSLPLILAFRDCDRVPGRFIVWLSGEVDGVRRFARFAASWACCGGGRETGGGMIEYEGALRLVSVASVVSNCLGFC